MNSGWQIHPACHVKFISASHQNGFRDLFKHGLQIEEQLNFIRSRNKFGMTYPLCMSCCPEGFRDLFSISLERFLDLQRTINFIRSRNKFGMTYPLCMSCCPEGFRDLFSISLERFLDLNRTKLYKIPK